MNSINVEIIFKTEGKKLVWTLTLSFKGAQKVISGEATSKNELSDPLKQLFGLLKKQMPLSITTNKSFIKQLAYNMPEVSNYSENIDIAVIKEQPSPEKPDDLPEYLWTLPTTFFQKSRPMQYADFMSRMLLGYSHFKANNQDFPMVPIFEQAKRSGLFPDDVILEDILVEIEDALERVA